MTRTQLQARSGYMQYNGFKNCWLSRTPAEQPLITGCTCEALVWPRLSTVFGLADFKGEITLNSLLTLVCEWLFSDVRSRFDFEMPLMLQFIHLFGSNLQESLKRMTACGFCYYTSRKSYYPCPQVSLGLHFLTFPKMPVPSLVQMDGVSMHQDAAWLPEGVWLECESTICAFLLHQRQARHFTNNAYLQKEPHIIPLTLSDGVHQPDEQPLHQPDHQTIIIPSGTAAAVQVRSCLIITSEDVTSAAQTVNVVRYVQPVTNWLPAVCSFRGNRSKCDRQTWWLLTWINKL